MKPIRKFELPTIIPPLETVLGRMGYNPKKTVVDPEILSMIQAEMEAAKKLIHPIGHTLEDNVADVETDSVILSSGIRFYSAKFADIHKISVKMTLMVCTIGPELPEECARLVAAGEMTRGVVLDAIASESVEAFADYINDILIRENTLLRLRPTMRFSPGYGGMTTVVQPELLKILESEKIGVTCNPENFILKPEKTITAMIGWER